LESAAKLNLALLAPANQQGYSARSVIEGSTCAARHAVQPVWPALVP